MNIWRLVAHHERPEEVAEWSRRERTIAIGWGGTGDLNLNNFQNEGELKKIVAIKHPKSTNSSNGGRSLWRLYDELQIGDLVILSASSSRVATMRVTSDYFFVGDEPNYYEHRRRAEVVPIDPNKLWQIAGKAAPGEGVYSTLIRCAKSLGDAEYNALVG